jgi:expansin (peptidoglycan-binding protein)
MLNVGVSLATAYTPNSAILLDNGQHIDVTVGDLCPGCTTDGLDLSEGAFAAIENLDAGRITVAWSFK